MKSNSNRKSGAEVQYWKSYRKRFKKQLKKNRLKSLGRIKSILVELKNKTPLQKERLVKSIGAW